MVTRSILFSENQPLIKRNVTYENIFINDFKAKDPIGGLNHYFILGSLADSYFISKILRCNPFQQTCRYSYILVRDKFQLRKRKQGVERILFLINRICHEYSSKDYIFLGWLYSMALMAPIWQAKQPQSTSPNIATTVIALFLPIVMLQVIHHSHLEICHIIFMLRKLFSF